MKEWLRRPAPNMLRYILLFALAILLSACGPLLSASELVGAGGGSPRQVVESFLEDLNAALSDPALATPEARRVWAERLASHFAPSERVDQRNAMGTMLARFTANAASPAVGAYATLEVTFSGTEVIEQHDGRALVRVVDGQFILRFYNANGDLIRERSGGIIDLIGAQRDGLPTLQVGENWFMTEG